MVNDVTTQPTTQIDPATAWQSLSDPQRQVITDLFRPDDTDVTLESDITRCANADDPQLLAEASAPWDPQAGPGRGVVAAANEAIARDLTSPEFAGAVDTIRGWWNQARNNAAQQTAPDPAFANFALAIAALYRPRAVQLAQPGRTHAAEQFLDAVANGSFTTPGTGNAWFRQHLTFVHARGATYDRDRAAAFTDEITRIARVIFGNHLR